MNKGPYGVAIFESVYQTLMSEKIMKENNFDYKIIPVPRHISSDCGVCLRFSADMQDKVKEVLANKVDILEMHFL
ncbi:MAG: DUF3343 domain-containing protein [Deltaproteobacteria bacterium]